MIEDDLNQSLIKITSNPLHLQKFYLMMKTHTFLPAKGIFCMKTKLIISLAIALCSLSSYAAGKGTLCVESKFEVPVDAWQVAESLNSLGLPEQYFSEKHSFTVEMTKKSCAVSDGQGSLNETPLPDFASEGDTRTITQERNGWVSEWQQKFSGGSWVTMRFTRWRKHDV